MNSILRFPSKKNKVTLEDGVVVKRHHDGDALLREANLLRRLHQAGLAVPALLALEEDALRLEYLEGPTYADLVDTMTPQQADSLGSWLALYHSITGSLRGDCNLRNFLWSDGRCVGVDFEDREVFGEPEVDMGKILAFAATYHPSFSTKKAESARFLLQAFRRTGGELSRIRQAYLAEITAMNQRRKGDPIGSQLAALFFAKLM